MPPLRVVTRQTRLAARVTHYRPGENAGGRGVVTLPRVKTLEEAHMLLRYACIACAAGLLATVAADTPASALTPAEKMETCRIGADAQKLVGKKRKAFISKCMADAAGSPR
jgi:psiF repeat